MIVEFKKIEVLDNGSARIVLKNGTDDFSFVVPKAFAPRICHFLINSSFDIGNSVLMLEKTIWPRTGGKESLFFRYQPWNGNKMEQLQITQYKCEQDGGKQWAEVV